MLAGIAAILAAACRDAAGGSWAASAAAFLTAALGGVAAFLFRLNERLIQVNRALIGQNARLLIASRQGGSGEDEAA